MQKHVALSGLVLLFSFAGCGGNSGGGVSGLAYKVSHPDSDIVAVAKPSGEVSTVLWRNNYSEHIRGLSIVQDGRHIGYALVSASGNFRKCV